ncbi:bifunctional cobalt-precorrin-7 (C(5))-methyltransferase/cobalt-precorrin-6B (C(15))-methyltransferase [Actinoplanes sp. TFC3]|uniref:bifunctional cobalt-precorrin-7 (C(5))-methyltransferase/cobalt-precorrin-6B (C(15))-methyltransferase n=1 Tax=Actinoplanes sp. TFC3 TaxID=1710355 RepID=UPI00082F59E4|nr:bifunctional cobalt-precorrin-7 (C(5))-methyltransferase/cobalt-precorrin-6B (C(15))-methyltransferase [Actinoplanes sp. TFC3]
MTDNPARLTVVGIGADGWSGLSGTARAALSAADVIFGSERQLDLLPAGEVPGDRVAWPSPMLPALPGLLDAHRDRRVAVVASGDPMFHGVGATLQRFVNDVTILPHPSSVSLAAARLGWPLADVDLLSVVTAPVAELHPLIHPNRRILVLGRDAGTPAQVAALLQARGYGSATMTILGQLGSENETLVTGAADTIQVTGCGSLNVIGIQCGRGGAARPRVPGLPDDAFDTDGQLTKREVRAVTLALLGPQPGEILWDIGAGSGSIAIEWMRSHSACRAVAIESDATRAGRIEGNARALGVPEIKVVQGRAPAALTGLPTPDVVFIGGGVTREGVLEAAWDALPAGGRLVANAVTLESEAVLAAWYAKLGGELTRLAVSRASPIGGFTGWRAMMPVTIWAVVKP